MRRVYIVLTTKGVGGCEKRFTDIWHGLVSQGLDVHLVIDKVTHFDLTQQSGYKNKLSLVNNIHIVDYPSSSFWRMIPVLWKFFDSQPRGCIIHYPLAYVPGLQTRYGHRLVMSWVNSAMPSFSYSWRNAINVWIGFILSNHLDVLNPLNLAKIVRFPRLRVKSSLTSGGTIVDSEIYFPSEKFLDFVFVGRLESEKQSLRFVKLLPEVHHVLQQSMISKYRFIVCGDGSEKHEIMEILNSNDFDGVPLHVGFSSNVEDVLGHAAIFFSLQKTSNYPSKALAEAMSCGAFPVITQVGESELMTKGCRYHYFLPRDFLASDLIDAISKYLAYTDSERKNIVETVSSYAVRRFCAENQVNYFRDIYSRL